MVLLDFKIIQLIVIQFLISFSKCETNNTGVFYTAQANKLNLKSKNFQLKIVKIEIYISYSRNFFLENESLFEYDKRNFLSELKTICV